MSNRPASVPSYRLYREQSGEAADFWLHAETIPARTHLHNWEIALHRHDAFFQLFLLTAGAGELMATDGAEPFSSPCVLFIPPGAAHGFRFTRDVDGLVVTALADRLATVAATDRALAAFAMSTRVVTLSKPGDGIAGTIKRLHDETAKHRPGSGLLLEALVVDALVSLGRQAIDATDDIPAGGRDALRHAELETLIAAHFREHRPVAFYAERIGISSAHLNRISRRMSGASVCELATGRLLDAAKRELVFTPSPVQSIAYGLGFQDPAYFNRFFRKHVGTTPGAFREAERARLQA
ncbi:MAG: helix-turn-helix domain-containing protein [Rhizobiaceae bacterium]|nr:helix-turn-helix domain-containing protein [Rhizobiaceae bacterium]MCV0409138.1 helix-turn-helix domain-containing protein [Rhizobiaceae bacterium]